MSNQNYIETLLSAVTSVSNGTVTQVRQCQIRAESDQVKMQFKVQESEKEHQFAMLMVQSGGADQAGYAVK